MTKRIVLDVALCMAYGLCGAVMLHAIPVGFRTVPAILFGAGAAYVGEAIGRR